MHYDVIEARYVRDYVVWVRFRDGNSGAVDLEQVLHGPIFEPLKDPAYFANFSINADFYTLCWPNGADIAPESLYDRVQRANQQA